MAKKTIDQTYPSSFRRPFNERIIIEIKNLHIRVRALT